MNIQCPKCGGHHVQLSNVQSKHGCLWLILFGIYYLAVLFIKWCIGLIVFILYDSWAYFVHNSQGKGHVWECRKWFSNEKRTYYCHDCGYNFKG